MSEDNKEAAHEDIVVLEHMTPSQMADVMQKVANVTTKMLALALAGGGFGPSGPANQIAQSVIQAAIHSSAAAAMLMDAARQVMGVGMMPGPGPRRMN